MDITSNPHDELHPAWHEAFPETRTLPGGWDLTEMPRFSPQDTERRPAVAAVRSALSAEWIERRPDPFPEPGGFPSGWDLSGVLALERERMMEKNSQADQLAGFWLPVSLDVVACETV